VGPVKAKAIDAYGYIYPVAVGQCCATGSWSDGATSLTRLMMMMMMNIVIYIYIYIGLQYLEKLT